MTEGQPASWLNGWCQPQLQAIEGWPARLATRAAITLASQLVPLASHWPHWLMTASWGCLASQPPLMCQQLCVALRCCCCQKHFRFHAADAPFRLIYIDSRWILSATFSIFSPLIITIFITDTPGQSFHYEASLWYYAEAGRLQMNFHGHDYSFRHTATPIFGRLIIDALADWFHERRARAIAFQL